MMYLIYNQDGSIKFTNLNEVITQGSTTTKIFVNVGGIIPSETVGAIATYKLANNETSSGNGEATLETINNESYNGWLFTLTQDETYYYGTLLMSIKIFTVGTNEVLFTIPVELTVNKTGFDASSTTITITQYTNLVGSISTQNADFESRIYDIESNYVSLSGEQIITGDKRFDGDITFNHNIIWYYGSGDFIIRDGMTNYGIDFPRKSGTLAMTDELSSTTTIKTGTIALDTQILINTTESLIDLTGFDYMILTYANCKIILPTKNLTIGDSYFTNGVMPYEDGEDTLYAVKVYDYKIVSSSIMTIEILDTNIGFPEGESFTLVGIKL